MKQLQHHGTITTILNIHIWHINMEFYNESVTYGNINTWIGTNWIKYSQHIIIGEELTIFILSYKVFFYGLS